MCAQIDAEERQLQLEHEYKARQLVKSPPCVGKEERTDKEVQNAYKDDSDGSKG